jgi:hypothetical protein
VPESDTRVDDMDIVDQLLATDETLRCRLELEARGVGPPVAGHREHRK